MSDRTPPNDLRAEQAVLGAMMLSRAAADEVIDILPSSADFYRPAHATIYAALIRQLAADEPTDPVVMAHVLEASGDLQRVGGVSYLHDLVETVPTAANAAHYARIVAEKAALRRIIDAGTKIAQLGYDAVTAGRDVSEVVDAAQQIVHEATVGRTVEDVGPVSRWIDGEIDHLQAVVEGRVPRGLSTGIGSLDKLLGGFLPGQLVVPAGRPGMGKSTLGIGFARACARRGVPALVYSVEMSRRELMWRLLSDEADIDLTKFTSATLTVADLEKVRDAAKTIARWPMEIHDTYRTVPAIRSHARRFTQRHGAPGVIVVDYLQRLGSTGRADRRDLEVGEFARHLKTLAQDLGCTVIAPSQLNRGPENRSDKRPQLSDLRDSGEVEQEADVVILLHRDDYYDKECERAGEADLIVAKHRNGPTDTVTVVAQLHYSRFVDWDLPEESF